MEVVATYSFKCTLQFSVCTVHGGTPSMTVTDVFVQRTDVLASTVRWRDAKE
jgi:hypothetical protein